MTYLAWEVYELVKEFELLKHETVVLCAIKLSSFKPNYRLLTISFHKCRLCFCFMYGATNGLTFSHVFCFKNRRKRLIIKVKKVHVQGIVTTVLSEVPTAAFTWRGENNSGNNWITIKCKSRLRSAIFLFVGSVASSPVADVCFLEIHSN